MIEDIRLREPKPAQQNKQSTFKPVVSEADEPAFVPPNPVEQESSFMETNNKTTTKSRKRIPKLHHIPWGGVAYKHATKKQRIIGLVIITVLLLAGGGGAYALQKHFSKPVPVTPAVVAIPKKEEPPKPTTEASRLTGVQIDPAINKRPVTSIQIENSPDARPQSGLKDAGVIYEAIAEGGITRFNASFLEAQPDYIGPVRSVRPYYAVLAAPFDPIFVHAGGSADGLAKLRDLGLKDLDHGANGAAFRRVSDRYAPHNLYTSMADLDKAATGRGYTSSNVKGFLRKDEQKGQPVTARVVDINMSSPLYNVHYDYDPASNSYKRVMAGKPHVDYKSNEQLAPKVVVALAMNFSQNGIYSVYQVIGSGSATVFQDGQVIQGTWKKTGEKEQFEFFDATGKPLKLDAGQTWFTLVKAQNNVTFAP